MFKYLWIIILAIYTLIFVSYSIYAIYKSFKEAVDLMPENSKAINYILNNAWNNFMSNHNILFLIWINLIIIGSIALITASLIVYFTPIQ